MIKKQNKRIQITIPEFVYKGLINEIENGRICMCDGSTPTISKLINEAILNQYDFKAFKK